MLDFNDFYVGYEDNNYDGYGDNYFDNANENSIEIEEIFKNGSDLIDFAEKGDIDSILTLLKTKRDRFDPIDLSNVFTKAAQNGKLDVISLFDNNKLVPHEATWICALNNAIEGGHMNVVGYLLSNHQFLEFHKISALKIASDAKQVALLKYLLLKIGTDFQQHNLKDILKIAIDNRHTDVAIQILRKHPELKNDPDQSKEVNRFISTFDKYALKTALPLYMNNFPNDLIQRITTFLPSRQALDEQESVKNVNKPKNPAIYPL